MPDNGGNEVIGQRGGKGVLACSIACEIFEELGRAGIPNHFVDRLSEDSIRVRKTEPIRLEFISRNLAYGSYLRRHPKAQSMAKIEGTKEITFKDDSLDDPPLSAGEAVSRKIIGAAELPAALELLNRVADGLTRFYKSKNLDMADLKMEVGRIFDKSKSPSLIVIDDLGFDNTRVFKAGSLLEVEELHAAMAIQ